MANPSVRASNVTQSSAGTFAVTKPTGTADGDLLVAFQANTSGSQPAAPTGWTLFDAANPSGPPGNLQCFYKVASSEPSSWTFNGGALNDNVVWTAAIQNAPSAPDVATNHNSGSGTAPTTNAWTTANNGELVLVAFSNNAGDAITGLPGGFTTASGTSTNLKMTAGYQANVAAGSNSAVVGSEVGADAWLAILAMISPVVAAPVLAPPRPAIARMSAHDEYRLFSEDS